MFKSKKVFLIFSFLFLSLINVVTRAQEAFPVLLISPTPEISGMGETGTGIANNSSAIFLNPGGLAFQKGLKFNFTYCGLKFIPQNLYQPDNSISSSRNHYFNNAYYINFNLINYFDDIGTFSTSVYSYQLGVIPYTYFMKELYEYYILLGYSRMISDNIGLGLNLKYIHGNSALDINSIDGGSDGWAFDFGVLYKLEKFIFPFVDLDLSDRLNFGLNLANMGPQVTYDCQSSEIKHPLPFNLRLGIGINLINSAKHRLDWAVDFRRTLVKWHNSGEKPDDFYKSLFTAWEDGGLKRVESSTGLEYNFIDPEFTLFENPINFTLRTGYYHEDKDYGNGQYLAFGGSVNYLIFGFNVSYIFSENDNPSLDKIWRLGMNLNL